MRLDHLLSRENVEGETRRHILRSIKYSNVFVRDRQERLPKEPLGSNVLRSILCIVFRVRENQTSQAMQSILAVREDGWVNNPTGTRTWVQGKALLKLDNCI